MARRLQRSEHASVRIGTSGWSYPSGRGTWNGVFYPAPAPTRAAAGRKRSASGPRRKFDELAYYAEHFDVVEVNSTFYRPVSAETAKSWANRTPPGFEFAIKLYQKFTHPKMFVESTGKVDATVGDQDIEALRRGLAPLLSSGKLGPVLAQFPPSFKASPGTFDYLEWLLHTLKDLRCVVELRHRSWSDDPRATAAVLSEHGASLARIDEPKFRTSIGRAPIAVPGDTWYLRLHGRNAAQWWKHEATEDRYNYLYSAEELGPYVKEAKAARSEVKRLYMITNNHFEAKSVANAVMLKQSLEQPVTGRFPRAFVERYPELEGVVHVEPEPDTAEDASRDDPRLI